MSSPAAGSEGSGSGRGGGVKRVRGAVGVGADGAEERVRGDRRDLDLRSRPGRLDHLALPDVERHVRGLREVDHQVPGPQLVQRHPGQPFPLLLAGPGNGPAGVRPRLRGEAGAVEGPRPLGAPDVRFADLGGGVGQRGAARGRGRTGTGAAEGPGPQQLPLRVGGVGGLPRVELRELTGGERGQRPLDLLQLPADLLLAFPHLPDQLGLGVPGLAGGRREPAGLPLALGQPGQQGGLPGALAGGETPLVQGGLGIAAEQHPGVRGKPRAPWYCSRASRPATALSVVRARRVLPSSAVSRCSSSWRDLRAASVEL